jgi:hypothetical protein
MNDMNRSDIFIEDIPNIRPAAHAAKAVETPDGSLLLCWYCGSYEGAEDEKLAAAWRSKAGKWEPGYVLIDRFDVDGQAWIPEIGHPIVFPDGHIEVFYICYTMEHFAMRGEPPRQRWVRQLEGTRTFRAPVVGRTAGEPQLLMDTPCLLVYAGATWLRGGRMILPFCTEFGVSNPGVWHTHFLLSDDQGKSFRLVADLHEPPGCLEPVVAQLPDGKLICHMRYGATGGGHIWHSQSDDDGETWQPVSQTNLRSPHSGTDLAASQSGRLVIAYNDSYYLRTPLCVGISDDEGKTWRVRDVIGEAGEYSYPDLLQTADGQWHLFFTNQRTHISHASFDEAWLEGGRKVIGL